MSAAPKFTALGPVDIGGYGRAEDGSDVVRRFKRGQEVPDAHKLEGILGLVDSGYLKPANEAAEQLIERKRG